MAVPSDPPSFLPSFLQLPSAKCQKASAIPHQTLACLSVGAAPPLPPSLPHSLPASLAQRPFCLRENPSHSNSCHKTISKWTAADDGTSEIMGRTNGEACLSFQSFSIPKWQYNWNGTARRLTDGLTDGRASAARRPLAALSVHVRARNIQRNLS